MRTIIYRDEALDMLDAHADALHAEHPREGCPDCEDRPLTDYPVKAKTRIVQEAISEVESAINSALIVVPDSPSLVALRKALLDARGNIREAIGEART